MKFITLLVLLLHLIDFCHMDCITLNFWGLKYRFNALIKVQPTILIHNWRLQVTFSKDITIQSYWECKLTEINKRTFLIENEFWNGRATFAGPVYAGFIGSWRRRDIKPTFITTWIAPAVDHNCANDSPDGSDATATDKSDINITTAGPNPTLRSNIISAFIKGGSIRVISLSQTIALDATASYDPEDPKATLSFSWSCLDNALGPIPSQNSSFPPSTCSFPEVYDQHKAVISIPTTNVKPGNYTFRVYLQNEDKFATYDQKVVTIDGFAPKMEIQCIVNCGRSVLSSYKLSLNLKCENCARLPEVGYLWSLESHNGVGFAQLPTRSSTGDSQECDSIADIVLIYDTSSSIDDTEWQMVKSALWNFALRMDIRFDRTRFAAVSFSTEATVEFFFDSYDSKDEVLDAIADLPFRPGRTNLADGLKAARETVLTRSNRPDVPDIVLVFTDGQPNFKVSQTSNEAHQLKNSVDQVFAIGITPGIESSILYDMASSNQDVIQLWSFSDLPKAVNTITNQLCTPNPVIQDSEKESIVISDGLAPRMLYKATGTLNCPSCAHNFTTEHQFYTHPPPEGGKCSVSPTKGTSFETPFIINCTNWRSGTMKGLNLPSLKLTYTIKTTASSGPDYIVYHSSSSTTSGLFLAPGRADNNNYVPLTVHVTDEEGGFTVVPLFVMVRLAPKTPKNTLSTKPTLSSFSANVRLALQVNPSQTANALATLMHFTNRLSVNRILHIYAVAANSADDEKTQNTVINGTAKLVNETPMESLPIAVQASEILSAATRQPQQIKDRVEESTAALTKLTNVLKDLILHKLYLAEDIAEAIMPAVWNTIQANTPTVEVPQITPGSKGEVKFVRNLIGDEVEYASPREMGHYVQREVRIQQYLRFLENSQAQQLVTQLLTSEATIDKMLMNSLAPGETPLNFTTEQAIQYLQKSTAMKITETHLHTPTANVIFGKAGAGSTSDIVLFQATAYAQNHYTWSNPSVITSGIMDLKLNKENEETFDLKADVILEFPSDLNASTTDVSFTTEANITYMVNITEDNAAVLVEISSGDITKFQYFLRKNQLPTLNEYILNGTIESATQNITNDTTQLFLSSGSLSGAGVYFLTLTPLDASHEIAGPSQNRSSRFKRDLTNTENDTLQEDSTPKSYSLKMAMASCRAWDEKGQKWTNGGEIVMEKTTFERVTCSVRPSKKKSSFAISFVAPPASIDFNNVWIKFLTIRDNSAVFVTVVVMLLLWIILLVILIKLDKRDHQTWKAHLVEDAPGQKDSKHFYFYTLTVRTAFKWSAGTDAKVYCQLYGKDGDSGARQLSMKNNMTFSAGSIRVFILRTPKWLGPLCNLRIWHDNSAGKKSPWFLEYIIVEDHKMAVRSTFLCHNWLAADNKYVTHVERYLYVSTKDEITEFGFLFGELSCRKWRDNHLWVSVLLRPMNSNFTRAERVTCCFSAIFMSMLSSATFYETDLDVQSPRMVQFGPFIFTAHELWVSFISVLIVLPVNLFIIHIFRRVQRFSEYQEPAEGVDFITFKDDRANKPNHYDTLWTNHQDKTEPVSLQITNEKQKKQSKSDPKAKFRSNVHKVILASRMKSSTAKGNNNDRDTKDNEQPKRRIAALRSAVSMYNTFRKNQTHSGQQERRRRSRQKSLINNATIQGLNTNNNSNKVRKSKSARPKRSANVDETSTSPPAIFAVIDYEDETQSSKQRRRPKTATSADRKLHTDKIEVDEVDPSAARLGIKSAWTTTETDSKEQVSQQKLKGDKNNSKSAKKKGILKNVSHPKSKKVQWVDPNMDSGNSIVPKKEGRASKETKSKDKKQSKSNKSKEHKKLKPKAYENDNNNAFKIDKPRITQVKPIHPDNGRAVMNKLHQLLKQPCPKWTLPIAWTLAVLVNLTSVLFVTLYSLEWGDALSRSWLKAYFLSLAESVLLADPCLVLLAALFGTLMLYRARHRISSYEDTEDKKTEEQNERIETEAKEEIIDALLQETKQYARKAKAKSAFKSIALFVGLLILVISIGYSTSDYNSYLIHSGLKSTFTPTFYQKVNNPATYFWWLKNSFIPNFFVTQDENGIPLPWDQRLYMADRASLRIGPARLRQIRIHEAPCPVPVFPRPCKPKYDRSLENRDRFGPLLNKTQDFLKLQSINAWRYQSQLELDGLPYRGFRAIYSGGGYVADLDFSKTISLQIIRELEDHLWLDSKTRAVFVEFSVYSANVHLIAYVTLLAEFPDSTGVIKSFSAHIMRTHVIESSTIYYFVCSILLAIYWFGFIAITIRDIKSLGWKYIVSLDHWLNILIILIEAIVFIAFIVRQTYLSKTLKQIHLDKNDYIQFRPVTEANNVFQNAVAFLNLVVILKTIFVLRINRRLKAFLETLKQASKPVASFLVLFGILFMAYTSLFHLKYGAYLFDYFTLQRTWGTLFSVGLGKFDVQELLQTNPSLTPWLFSTYMIVMNWIFLSILVSIILDVHCSVMKRFDLEKDAYDLMGVFLENFILKESDSNKTKESSTDREKTKESI